ncbi:hypothetical protein RJ639_044852 [Escallonia herrerae]|uniref:Uncharacterized protein n=1 Tax=Escallonia herrerae TaxID=1293975 RepID=A0AA88W9I8_9ASTE|nr:hypothetical protein RJ639_044852 [Escallonia herrerae]
MSLWETELILMKDNKVNMHYVTCSNKAQTAFPSYSCFVQLTSLAGINVSLHEGQLGCKSARESYDWESGIGKEKKVWIGGYDKKSENSEQKTLRLDAKSTAGDSVVNSDVGDKGASTKESSIPGMRKQKYLYYASNYNLRPKMKPMMHPKAPAGHMLKSSLLSYLLPRLNIPLEDWISPEHGVFATRTQLTWAIYALFACLYFVSITRNAQPVGEHRLLVKLSFKIFMACIGVYLLYSMILTPFATTAPLGVVVLLQVSEQVNVQLGDLRRF